MQQQQLFLRPVLIVFINEAVIVIPTFGSDTISHSHFKISASFPKNILGFGNPKISKIFLVTLATTGTSVQRKDNRNNAGASGRNIQNKRSDSVFSLIKMPTRGKPAIRR